MPARARTAIAIVGIVIGKNSFHIVGLDDRGAIALRQKRSRSQVEARCQHATLPGWHGGLLRRASSPSQA